MSDMVMNYQDDVIKKINMELDKIPKPMGQVRPDEDYPWLVFLLENTRHAINAKHVLHVAVLYEIIPFEDAPAYCPGIAWNRDGMTRLLDLRLLFGLGDYQSIMARGEEMLPITITIELKDQKHGIIVDKVVAMKYFRDALVPVISPDNFSDLEYEKPDIKIDWSARIDMRLLAKSLREKGSR